YVVVPRHVRERIYRVSPAFAELRSSIEGDLGAAWAVHGCRAMPETCGDITTGWFMWLLRDAVAGAGHYRSAPAAAASYRRLADEVDVACRSGSLRCRAPRATMAPPWRSEYRGVLMRSLVSAAAHVIRFKEIFLVARPSAGASVDLVPFAWITRER